MGSGQRRRPARCGEGAARLRDDAPAWDEYATGAAAAEGSTEDRGPRSVEALRGRMVAILGGFQPKCGRNVGGGGGGEAMAMGEMRGQMAADLKRLSGEGAIRTRLGLLDLGV